MLNPETPTASSEGRWCNLIFSASHAVDGRAKISNCERVRGHDVEGAEARNDAAASVSPRNRWPSTPRKGSRLSRRLAAGLGPACCLKPGRAACDVV